jgi:hypothetical protein
LSTDEPLTAKKSLPRFIKCRFEDETQKNKKYNVQSKKTVVIYETKIKTNQCCA